MRRIAWVILAVLLLTSIAYARGFMRGVGGNGGISGPFLSVSCPSGGLVSVPSTNFTITYPAATFNGTTNNITMTDGSTGTFTPASPIVPSNVSTSTTFTYTPPATPGTYTITVNNNIVVPVIPPSCPYVASGSVAQNPLPLVIP